MLVTAPNFPPFTIGRLWRRSPAPKGKVPAASQTLQLNGVFWAACSAKTEKPLHTPQPPWAGGRHQALLM